MKKILAYIPHVLAILITFVFVDSLRFKFTNHPNTENIFGILDTWAASFGAAGLFAHGGLFSAYVIGSVELLASVLLILGIAPRFRKLQVLGALLAFLVMTGALFFHLFTPLGIDPNNDGGGLFVVACVLWVSSIVLLIVRRKDIVLHR